MFSGPIRGGTRGGQGDFKWSDVADDKDRENYLGHSILAPVGRWQKNRDITWYNKQNSSSNTREENERIERERLDQRREELRRIKQLEEDALSVALGFQPAQRNRNVDSQASIGTSSNSLPLGDTNNNRSVEDGPSKVDAEREDKRLRKAQRRVERDLKKEEKEKRKVARKQLRRRDRDLSSAEPTARTSKESSHNRPDRQDPCTGRSIDQRDRNGRRGSVDRSRSPSPRGSKTHYSRKPHLRESRASSPPPHSHRSRHPASDHRRSDRIESEPGDHPRPADPTGSKDRHQQQQRDHRRRRDSDDNYHHNRSRSTDRRERRQRCSSSPDNREPRPSKARDLRSSPPSHPPGHREHHQRHRSRSPRPRHHHSRNRNG